MPALTVRSYVRFAGALPAFATVALFAVGSSNPIFAAPITTPTGLLPGAQYRLVFVTSGVTDATSQAFAYYDAIVAAEANAVPELSSLATTWRVIGTAPQVLAAEHTDTSPGYVRFGPKPPAYDPGLPTYLLNNTIFAATYEQLWYGVPYTQLSVDRTGAVVGPSEVWTGLCRTLFDGTCVSPNYGALGFLIGENDAPLVGRGFTSGQPQQWFGADSALKTEFRHLYAMSGVLTATIPEASPSAMLALAFAALLLVRRVRAS